MRIAIIGSAGRNTDAAKWSRELYLKAYSWLARELEAIPKTLQEKIVVSGGAAWADHLAVSVYKNKIVDALELHLPAGLYEDGYDQTSKDGQTANRYHRQFSEKVGTNTLQSLHRLISKPSPTLGVSIHRGFQARNKLVAASDRIFAFTFGAHSGIYTKVDLGYDCLEESGLKPGGTWDTWSRSKAELKYHKNLHDFL